MIAGHEPVLGRLGHLIVAIAEPHRDTVVEYNRWFESEHMYDAVLVGPGAFAANRFVATRDLKSLRYPTDGQVFTDASIGSFVALYYLAAGTAEEHFAWSFPQNAWLGRTGRNNPDRTLVLTWLCDFDSAVTRDDHTVPPHVALDHPYQGLVMAWIERHEETELDDLRRRLRDDQLPAIVRASSPIAQVQLWSPRDFPDTRQVPTTPGSVVANSAAGRQLLTLFFLDRDPSSCWDDAFAPLGEELERTGAGRLRLVAPFVPTIRAAPSYLDDLW